MYKRQKVEEGKPTRWASDKQEKMVAAAVGGEKTANSGATAFSKGDVLTDDWLLECKTKMKPSESITVHKEWFEKNINESVFMGKRHSAVVINFGPGEKNYYIIDEDEFIQLKEYLSSVEK